MPESFMQETIKGYLDLRQDAKLEAETGAKSINRRIMVGFKLEEFTVAMLDRLCVDLSTSERVMTRSDLMRAFVTAGAWDLMNAMGIEVTLGQPANQLDLVHFLNKLKTDEAA